MSLPKHIPSHSSSPSKSSLRSTSGTSTQRPSTGRALLPSPHFEDPILAQSQAIKKEEEKEEEGEDVSELREPDGSTFQPFFTLIEDTLAHTHHHPTVHYIFDDDDTDIVTEAACRSLARDDPFMTTTTNTEAAGRQSPQAPDADPEREPSKLPAPTPGVREHYLLLDVQPTAAAAAAAAAESFNTATAANTRTSYKVTRAHSLSAEWQVTSTAISNAPTIDAVDEDSSTGGGGSTEGLMLRIEGRGVVPTSDDDDNQNQNQKETGTGRSGKEKQTLEEMVRRFETGLADIRRTIDAGGSLGGEEQGDEVGDSARAGNI